MSRCRYWQVRAKRKAVLGILAVCECTQPNAEACFVASLAELWTEQAMQMVRARVLVLLGMNNSADDPTTDAAFVRKVGSVLFHGRDQEWGGPRWVAPDAMCTAKRGPTREVESCSKGGGCSNAHLVDSAGLLVAPLVAQVRRGLVPLAEAVIVFEGDLNFARGDDGRLDVASGAMHFERGCGRAMWGS